MNTTEAENTIPGTLVSSREISDKMDLDFMEMASLAIEASGRGLIKLGSVGEGSKGKSVVDVYNFTPTRFSFDEFDEVVENGRTFEPGNDFESIVERVVVFSKRQNNTAFIRGLALRRLTEQHLIAQLKPQGS